MAVGWGIRKVSQRSESAWGADSSLVKGRADSRLLGGMETWDMIHENVRGASDAGGKGRRGRRRRAGSETGKEAWSQTVRYHRTHCKVWTSSFVGSKSRYSRGGELLVLGPPIMGP